MKRTQGQVLAEMGISPLWRLRAKNEAGDVKTETVPQSPPVCLNHSVESASVSPDVEMDDWERLEKGIASCRACPLFEHRRQTVPGMGDRQAEWLFIGEGPGAEEDASGLPFVGQAGKLLDSMLAAIRLKRGEKVYIANAVKCRPPGNRTPETGEIARCQPFLERQIELIQPRLIVLLGRSAVHAILREERASLASLRGKRFEYKGIPVVVTYHPAYLLRSLPEKAKTWEDLLFACRIMEGAKNPSLF